MSFIILYYFHFHAYFSIATLIQQQNSIRVYDIDFEPLDPEFFDDIMERANLTSNGKFLKQVLVIVGFSLK